MCRPSARRCQGSQNRRQADHVDAVDIVAMETKFEFIYRKTIYI